MDKHFLPFFFNNVKPTIYTQKNKQHLAFISKKIITLPSSAINYVIDMSAVHNNQKLIFTSLKLNNNQTCTLHSNKINYTTTNTGLLWPIREVVEFFGFKNFKTIDNRNLLLDYSSNMNPLLKDFPCEGLEEVYFNFYSQKVSKFKIFFIEL